ncbi:MAG: LPS-assembly protein LptD [Paludibacter sp.]|nr:LPS-assembly protein LptD [Bacteroidales bacterium]MCM1068871.1 LPS-assembly protein LptD [Prevotella sp.]MCM1353132.1 LPS-assembly protein LptD [Bacteroides sp.]MCM1442454.1 LPS-assembly protein LptD [Muribaculum sp.]MCM1481297.1 LPS-assembly protein LptD [Paludibacter sp.]
MSVSEDSLIQTPDTLPKKTSMIDAVINYQANDSIVLLGNGTAFLHGSGDVKYKTMNLTSEYIRVKMDSSLIYAQGVLDTTTGEWKGLPVFADGNDRYESKEMTYNLRTQKGYIRHVVTEQGEGYVISEKTKKGEGDILMMADAKYTTCDDHEHPHFYLALTKAKAKPGDYIATGPAYLVVGDVPLPLAIPFGFFPFTNTYSSGLIMPSFGDDYTRGLYLRGLGYYFAINDYVDLEVTGDIYTKGTWAVTAQSKYVKRYKFNGNFSFSYRNDVTGEKGMPDYTKATNMSIRWTHTQDTKANPYSNFSASVNFSTSGYNRSNINSYYNAAANSENTKSSSISYTQRFPNSPWSISMSALVSQRTKDSTLSLTLPDIAVNMSTIYPFKRKNPIGKEKWYEKISIRYSGNIKNSISCKEKDFLHSNFVRDWQNGVKHNIPVSASFVAFKYLTISPSITYNERWYFQRTDQSWDEKENQVHRDTTNGFYRVWDLSTSLSMSTKLYAFYTPIRKLFGDKVDRFRHVITPSISFTYTPDCEDIRAKLNHNYYGSYQRPVVDRSTGDTIMETVNYSRFQNALYGTPSQGSNGSLGFSLGNNIEMKIRNDKDTTGKEPYKVISLIDNLSISGSYNFLADSMQLSNFRVQLRLKLPLNYTLNLSGEFDPYMYGLTASGTPKRINKFYWSNGRFPHFKGTSTSFSYTFNNDTFRKWFGKKTKEETDPDNPDTDFDPTRPTEEENRRPTKNKNDEVEDGYIKTEIPWSLSINYTVRYGEGNEFDYKKMYYKMVWTHNLSFSGSIGFGNGWKVSATTSYDFKAKQFTYTNFNVTRDLHCWSMSASFVPFGPYKSYTFHIGVNASMLADLKYDKSSAESTNQRVSWW